MRELLVLFFSLFTTVHPAIPTPTPTLAPLTLDAIFHPTSSASPASSITLITTGDILPARTINAKSVADSNFTWEFAQTTNLLKNADLTFVNLETPLTSPCPVNPQGTTFCGDVRNVQGLTAAGIDVVNLANNHSTNFGTAGLTQTRDLLTQNHILSTDFTHTASIVVKDTHFTFLGFNDTFAPLDPKSVATSIAQAKSNSDVVIVAFHWGIEYTSTPTLRQRQLAHTAIDAGASLIAGHHPHWIQSIELYKEHPIFYSHGNFIFDQFWSQPTQLGLAVKTTFYQNKVIAISLVPIRIVPPGVATIAQPAEASTILDALYQSSLKFPPL